MSGIELKDGEEILNLYFGTARVGITDTLLTCMSLNYTLHRLVLPKLTR